MLFHESFLDFVEVGRVFVDTAQRGGGAGGVGEGLNGNRRLLKTDINLETLPVNTLCIYCRTRGQKIEIREKCNKVKLERPILDKMGIQSVSDFLGIIFNRPYRPRQVFKKTF